METSIRHFIYSSVLFKRRQDGSVDEEERERGSDWIEEKETPLMSPALCALTAAPEAVFCKEDPLASLSTQARQIGPDEADSRLCQDCWRAVIRLITIFRQNENCPDTKIVGAVFICNLE